MSRIEYTIDGFYLDKNFFFHTADKWDAYFVPMTYREFPPHYVEEICQVHNAWLSKQKPEFLELLKKNCELREQIKVSYKLNRIVEENMRNLIEKILDLNETAQSISL